MVLLTKRGTAAVNCKSSGLGDASPGVAVSGVKPSAAQIESHIRYVMCPGPPPTRAVASRTIVDNALAAS